MQGQQAFALWSVCPDGTHNAMREHRKRNGCGGEQQSPQTVFKLGTAGCGGGRHNDRDRHNDGEKKWQFPARSEERRVGKGGRATWTAETVTQEITTIRR